MDNGFNYKFILLENTPSELLSKITKFLELCFTQKNQTPEQKAEHDDKYCSKNDQIVGVTICLKRKILYHTKQIILGGIGGVCTLEEFRRKMEKQYTYLGNSGKRYYEWGRKFRYRYRELVKPLY